MTEVHYEWAPGQAYPRIQQHSVAKHGILRAYLTAYIRILTSNPNREEFRLALIDGVVSEILCVKVGLNIKEISLKHW